VGVGSIWRKTCKRTSGPRDCRVNLVHARLPSRLRNNLGLGVMLIVTHPCLGRMVLGAPRPAMVDAASVFALLSASQQPLATTTSQLTPICIRIQTQHPAATPRVMAGAAMLLLQWWVLLLATYLLASTTAVAEMTASSTTVFFSDGPAFIFTSSQGSLMIPVVSIKGSNKKGVAISANGTEVYTFTAPLLKVGWVVMRWIGWHGRPAAAACWCCLL